MQPDDYIQELNQQLTYLVSFARTVNELDLVAATFPEFRGAQDAGWNTAITAHEVYSELLAMFREERVLSIAEMRQALCLYSQLSEAGGVYECLQNMLGVIELKPYSMWPFQDIVRVKEKPRRVIGPNANAMFKRLAETSRSIGMKRLSELFEVTFRDDIRNGISHADYVLAPDGLRLRRRNGGHVEIVSYEDVGAALQIALGFFELLNSHVISVQSAYNPPKHVIGRFSAERRPMRYTIEKKDRGGLSISTDSPGFDSDEVYERQQYINNMLGGKVFTAYLTKDADDNFSQLRDDISHIGFDVQMIVFDTAQELQDLRDKIELQGLWALGEVCKAPDALLLATPYGFRCIKSQLEFEALLPSYEAVEYEQRI